MADAGDDLLDGEGLGDNVDFADLDGDAEDALLADDSSYSDPYHLRTVPTSGRDVYLESKHGVNDDVTSRNSSTIYHDVEEVAEGDEIIDDDEEDILELGVTDEFESELQDHPHNSVNTPTWIKQEIVSGNDNVSSLVINKRSHLHHHRIDSLRTGSSIKQEPLDDDTSGGMGGSNQQMNVVVTSSTEVLPQEKFSKNYDAKPDESDDDDNDEEQRDRFKTERTNVISLKNNAANKWGEIPDSLDSVVTRHNQQQQQQQRIGVATSPRGGGAKRGRPLGQQQSHKIHVNPHFKPAQQHQPPHQSPLSQHPQQINPSQWETQQPVQQPTYEQAHQVHHNIPPQHYGPPHMAPQPQPPLGPPQMYHQPGPPQEPHHPQPHVPQPPPGHWVRNEGPPPQPHFDPQFGGGHHMQPHGPPQQYYPPPPQQGPPPGGPVFNSQPPPYEQNISQHQRPPHQPPPLQPPYEYQPQQRLPQPPPPGVDDNMTHRSPIRTVQFSENTHQITIQMTDGRDLPPPYPNHQQFNHNLPQPPQYAQPPQNNNWINSGMTPPHPHPQQQFHPRFIPQGQRMPQPPPPLQSPVMRGQHPRFMRGHFRRGVMNRHPHPRQMHPQQNRPPFPGDIPPQGVQPIGPGGDNNMMFGPPNSNLAKRLGDPHQLPPVPFKQGRFNNTKNIVSQQQPQQPVQQQHVRKGPVMSNLCEVPTVDNIPDTTTRIYEQSMEDEDEETRQYRLKIAEQKRLREKLLKEKEVRRQMAAVKKQQEIQQKNVLEEPDVPQNNNNNNNIPTTTFVNQPQQHQQQIYNQQFQQNVTRQSVHKRVGAKLVVPASQGNNIQGQGPAIHRYRIVRVRAKDGTIHMRKIPMTNDGQFIIQQRLNQPQFQQHQFPQNQQQGVYSVPVINRRIVVDNVIQQNQAQAKFHAARKRAMKKNMTPVTTIVPTNFQAKKNMSAVTKVIPVVTTGKKVMTLGQRFSMQQKQLQIEKGTGGNQQQQMQQVQSQQQQQMVAKSNRKVISTTGPGGGYNGANIKVTATPPGPITHTVVVDNLTASTSKQHLTKMASQVGEVEKIILEPQLKRATITFKNTNSASAFFHKYQRKMVDLSMISISLVPEQK